MEAHPYLDTSFLPSWSRLTAEAVVPDITLALERARAAVDALAAGTESELTYENTLLAYEASTEELRTAWSRVNHLLEVDDTKARRDAHAAVLPQVSEFFAGLPLNEGLYRRVRSYAETAEAAALTAVKRRFLEETLADFRQYGAELPPEGKARLKAIEAELAEATKKFGENCLDSRNSWEVVIDDPVRLAGLPESARAAALAAARAKGLGTEEKPMWRFTLQAPSLIPLLTYLDDAELRRQAWEANVAVGWKAPWDNTELVRRIVALRAEKARLLGKEHFPDLAIERRMAKTGRAALKFVEDLHAKAVGAFRREAEELEAFKASRTGGAAGRLAPWEIGYWSEKLRLERYAFDKEELRPYFALDRVVGGAFALAERLFAVRIAEKRGVETWHPEVRLYEIHDVDGRHLGSFYADWHPRESKSAGAWMNYLWTGGPRADGTHEPHLGLIVGNLTPPTADRPSLLTHDEVETVLHEFGHLLHHLLGEVEVKSLNGVNVAWDFVELPSQILENWTWEREGLDLLARHVETGECLPDELLARMKAARNFRSATATVRQLLFGKMDLEVHLRGPEFLAGDFEEALRAVLGDYIVPTEPPSPFSLRSFGHLFSSPTGYAAGYYSYKWAEVLDADAFSRFLSEGVLSPDVGKAFRASVLSRGNSAPPDVLFREFMGRDPDPRALLVRAGLVS